MNKAFEDFLEQEKRNFCQFRCSPPNMDVGLVNTIICPECKKEIDGDKIVNAVEVAWETCDVCPLNGFIREIRDSNDIRVRQKTKRKPK